MALALEWPRFGALGCCGLGWEEVGCGAAGVEV